MPTPTPLNEDLGTLLTAVVTKLQSASLPNVGNNVFLSLKPDAALLFPPNDQFVVVTPRKQTVDQGVRVGGGRSVMLMHGEMEITLWVRLVTDQNPQDTLWLTDTSYGALKTLGSLVNTLELYQPVDGSGNQVLPIGYELTSVDTYSREVKNESGGVVGWGSIVTSWQFDWTLSLNPQGP